MSSPNEDEETSMRKLFILAAAALLLAATARAQQTPRHHTRPPYSGPRLKKSGKAPLGLVSPRSHRQASHLPKPKAAHILVR